MIQSALFFILGILVAVFVAVLLGPSVWRRAFFLARRQVQAELPMTLAEIRADRDALRAEHAVSAARLEQSLRLERAEAAARKIQIDRQSETLKKIPQLEQQIAELEARLAGREQALQAMSAEKDTALEESSIVQAERERLQNHLSALETLADTLRIEITAQETENGKLMAEMRGMRRDRKDAAARFNELSTQLTAAQTELKSEKRRNSELQQKLEKLISELSDAQEKLERHMRNGASSPDDIAAVSDFSRENAALREEMAVLAARMVAATAEKEGAGSPIHALVGAEDAAEDAELDDRPKSLASRIRDLQ